MVIYGTHSTSPPVAGWVLRESCSLGWPQIPGSSCSYFPSASIGSHMCAKCKWRITHVCQVQVEDHTCVPSVGVHVCAKHSIGSHMCVKHSIGSHMCAKCKCSIIHVCQVQVEDHKCVPSVGVHECAKHSVGSYMCAKYKCRIICVCQEQVEDHMSVPNTRGGSHMCQV